jgi:FixJ family two-component response regulator
MITIVDDDPGVRNCLQELILSLGYDTLTFESAEQLLASGSIRQTNCLITDLQMPGLNGLELQSRLRDEGHGTPVIVVTGYPTQAQRTRAMQDGALCFLSKPVDEQVLIDCLALAVTE